MTTPRSTRTGYLTDLFGNRAVDVVNDLRQNRPTVPPEPAFQRAALAVGSAGRRGGVAAPRTACRHFDGGTPAHLSAHDRADGLADRPGAAGAGGERHGAEHDRHFHQRQWRRALCRHLAVHRQEDRAAGRRLAHSGGDPLARSHPAGQHDGAGGDRHGLAADAARGRRHRARSGLSAGWHEPAAVADPRRGAGPAQAVLALQDTTPSRRCAMAIGNT